MAYTVAELAGRLKQVYPDLTAEVFYDALWLSEQGVAPPPADTGPAGGTRPPPACW